MEVLLRTIVTCILLRNFCHELIQTGCGVLLIFILRHRQGVPLCGFNPYFSFRILSVLIWVFSPIVKPLIVHEGISRNAIDILVVQIYAW